uniref:Integrase catalytic domain-containing protein n=1 Tax=Tanacetum cinerariifolium TaxID=118510 RepID=A0A6L2MKZ7_TANCI|nr:hypothetical protein [Tanacetum cinerariifolium]
MCVEAEGLGFTSLHLISLILPQVESAYNRSVNRTTAKSPFEVVYERNPITPLDLVPVLEVGRFSEEGADQSGGDSDDEPDSWLSLFQEGEDDADAINERVNVTNSWMVICGLAGHFGRDKTLALLRKQFYWPKMKRGVNRLLERCRTFHIAKTHSINASLYTPLSVPVAPWKDVSLDFVLEIIKLHGVPKSLTSDRDVKFVSHFWRTFWTHLGSKLQFSSFHHPQTNGQTEVVNRSLGNILHSLIRDNAKQWDLILLQAEFTYNRSVNRTTAKSPFEVVYERNLISPLDLVPVPEVGWFSEEGANQSEQIKELHWSVQEHIIRHNKQYKEHADKCQKQVLYREGDLVWIYLCKERFSAWHFRKLKPRGDGPFCVLKKINDNTYKIALPDHFNVSATFNVADLSPYRGDSDDEPDSWLRLFQEREDDADAVNERVNVTNTLDSYFAATNICGELG